ncbi:MAG: TPM domain-containing protein [Geminicoccaceae bacterium]
MGWLGGGAGWCELIEKCARLHVGCLALIIAGLLPLTAAIHPIPAPPAVSVMDWAQLLSGRQRSAIADYRDRLRRDHDIDFRLVTARAAGDVNWASHEAFAALGVGDRSDSGRGLLLVVDPGADRIRLEVAAALEGVLTDTFVAYVEQRQMVPFFREGRVGDGILAATELIFSRAEQATAGQAFDPRASALFGFNGEASQPAAGPGAAPAEDDPAAVRFDDR